MQKEIIGNHILYCGDCQEVLPTLADNSIDCLLTDPPYASGGMTVASRISQKTSDKYQNDPLWIKLPEFAGDNLDQRLWMRFISGTLTALKPKLKQTAPYLLFIDWRQLAALQDTLLLNDYITKGLLVWDKGNARPVPNGFRQDAEFIVWGRRSNISKSDESCYLKGVYNQTNGNGTEGRLHITQKPVNLISDLLKITKADDVVLDCFMGSGTTGVSCQNLSRRFIGIEKTQEYFDVACKRIEAAIKQKEFDFGLC